jgi:hypothetical protein
LLVALATRERRGVGVAVCYRVVIAQKISV